ncbi:MAG: YdcF family protein [bacterium]
MKKKNLTYYLSLILVLIDALILFYLKYTMNDLPLSAFSISFIGNILNIIFTLGLVIGLIILIVSKHDIPRYRQWILLIFCLIMLIPHLILLFKTSSGYVLPDKYFLNYSLDKAFIGFLFILSEFTKILTLFYAWSKFTATGGLVFLKSLTLTVSTILILSVLSFIYTIGFKDSSIDFGSSEKYDVAVVLGAAVWSKNRPSTIFRGRIEKAFQLYKMGAVKKIQLTGGNAPGELSEAEVGFDFLKTLGMNTDDIFVETYTSTSSDQVKFIKSRLVEKLGFRRILIVTDHFHIRRAMEMCKFFKIQASGITSGYNMKLENLLYYRIRDSIGLLLFWFFGI